jgi:hypothetical protein
MLEYSFSNRVISQLVVLPKIGHVTYRDQNKDYIYYVHSLKNIFYKKIYEFDVQEFHLRLITSAYKD